MSATSSEPTTTAPDAEALAKTAQPFWRVKSLTEMSPSEWESLCDGCGKCCLHKLQYEDNDEVVYTNVACRLLDTATCRCTKYEERKRFVPDCVRLDASNIELLTWMPSTCAYRLIRDGQDLPVWHPLVSGNPDSVHKARQSVRGRSIPERRAGPLENYVVKWPE